MRKIKRRKKRNQKKLNKKLLKILNAIHKLPFSPKPAGHEIQNGWARFDYHTKGSSIRITIMTLEPFEWSEREKPFIKTSSTKPKRKIKRRK